MNADDHRFLEAYHYAFEIVFPSFLNPLGKLAAVYEAEIGPKMRRSYAASLLELMMLGVKCMTKFHRQSGYTRDSVDHFIAAYFPVELQWDLKKYYRAYEEGLLFFHVLTPPAEAGEDGRARETTVFPPEKLVASFTSVIDNFSRALLAEDASDYRARFFLNYEKIRKS